MLESLVAVALAIVGWFVYQLGKNRERTKWERSDEAALKEMQDAEPIDDDPYAARHRRSVQRVAPT